MFNAKVSRGLENLFFSRTKVCVFLESNVISLVFLAVDATCVCFFQATEGMLFWLLPSIMKLELLNFCFAVVPMTQYVITKISCSFGTTLAQG